MLGKNNAKIAIRQPLNTSAVILRVRALILGCSGFQNTICEPVVHQDDSGFSYHCFLDAAIMEAKSLKDLQHPDHHIAGRFINHLASFKPSF